jgi:hypothetical protein
MVNILDVIAGLVERGHHIGAAVWALEQLIVRGFLDAVIVPWQVKINWECFALESVREVIPAPPPIFLNGRRVFPPGACPPADSTDEDEGEWEPIYEDEVEWGEPIYIDQWPWEVLVRPTPAIWDWWGHSPAASPSIPAAPLPQVPKVVLKGPGEPPVVLGAPRKELTQAQYDVVKALLAAGETGLTKDQLVEKSHHGDAVNILKRLAKSDPAWGNVIRLAGKVGRRYRIG